MKYQADIVKLEATLHMARRRVLEVCLQACFTWVKCSFLPWNRAKNVSFSAQSSTRNQNEEYAHATERLLHGSTV